MTLTIIGHGYVGLVTAAIFADLGNTVWVIGRNREKINALNKGKIPFFEPGLEELVKRNGLAGRLFFTLDYSKALAKSQIIFICVGTPPAGDGRADLSSVFTVAEEIANHLNSYKVVVTKSTVPPGTNRKVQQVIQKKATTFDIASCPEFLREGSAIADTLSPDRIVIGTDNKRACDLLVELHTPINGKVVRTTIEAAEMIKYVSNSILSTKISFANAIAFLCEKVGADVEQVMDGVGLDKRIGRSFLSPGVGYGGSCFPKDVKALIAFAKDQGYDFKLLKAVDEINQEAVSHFVKKVARLCPLKGKTIGVLGLAFKPNTDDMREAPSVKIITKLQEFGASIRAYDPQAMAKAKLILHQVNFCKNAYEVAKGADALIILTEWNEFRQLDLGRIKNAMRQTLVIDGRNIYDPVKMDELGITYEGVGRS